MSSLVVHANRDRPRALEAPSSFTTRGPFDLLVENHGPSGRIHFHLDDELTRVARLSSGDRYLPADGTERVRVDVQPVDRPVDGTLTISAGYGAETAGVELTVAPDEEPASEGVEVDERLAHPQPDATDGVDRERAGRIALLVLAAVGLVAAVATAVTFESTVVVASAGLVALAVAAAAVAAFR